MPPAFEVLLLNTTIPQIQAAQSGDTYVVPRDIAFSTVASFAAGTAALPSIVATGDTNTGIWFPAADTVAISTGGTSRLRLDSSGNLGLGVTPSAWNTGYKAFVAGGTNSNNQVGGIASGSGITIVSTNYYRSTAPSDLYAGDGFAMKYTQSSGQHIWETAASGTAGNPITFTQAMTLDASGGLQIGRTSVIGTNNRLAIQMSGTSASSYTAASNAALAIDAGTSTNCVLNLVGGGDMGVFRTNSSNAYDVGISFGDNSNRILSFTTANTERARITSGGTFQVSSGGSVQVGGTAARATTAGTNRLDIFNGTAPVGTLTDGISIYSSSGEAYVMDAAGNATLFSPHDAETNEWIFKSKHTPTGKVLKIDVERLLKFVNDHFGLDAVHEFIEE